MHRIALLALAACGQPHRDLPPPDLEGVQAQFVTGTTAMADLVGISYQIPAGADAASAAIRAFAVSALHGAGVRHDRADLLWNVAEPARGMYDFSQYQTKVDALASAGAVALPILCYGTTWASASGDDHHPPDDPADYAAFAAQAVATFHLPAYEVWNEENLGLSFWHPRENADAYATLLADAAAAIRKADASAQVVLGGLLEHAIFTDAETFLDELYGKHDIARDYDVLAIHPYAIYPPATAPEHDDDTTGEMASARMIARLRALLAYYGDSATRPIWATEVGWPVYAPVDEELQARWLVRAFLALASAGVTRAYWYTLFDGPNPTTFPPEDAFGLYRYDDPSDGFTPQPKLGWQALTTLLATTGALAVTDDVTAQLTGATPATRAFRLTDPTGATAREVIVVWTSDDAAAPATVTLPSSPAQVLDMLGAGLPASPTVPLSGRPVYAIVQP